MRWRGAGLGLVVLSVAAGLFWRGRSMQVRPADPCLGCNVVIISVDSLRSDRFAYRGFPGAATPHLGRWAEGAVVFPHYRAAATLTPVSQAAVHTGLFPERNGLVNYRGRISPSVPTLPELLAAQGYATASITTTPDFAVYPGIRQSFARGSAAYEALGRFDYPFFRALDFVRARERDGRKFFLWLGLASVHWPYGAKVKRRFGDPAYAGPLAGMGRFPYAPGQNLLFQLLFDGVLYPRTPATSLWFWNFLDGKFTWQFEGRQAPLPLAEADLQHVRDLYDDNVADFDEKVTILLDELAREPLASKTVVMLLSEHGEDLHEHGSFHHHDLWETILRVPLLLKSPRLAAKVDPRPASGVDVAPTLLEHLGLPALPAVDGESLLAPARRERPVFFVRTPLWETVLNVRGAGPSPFDEFRKRDGHSKFKDYGMVHGKWKLLHRRSRAALREFSLRQLVTGRRTELAEFELYDLQADPGEARNLAEREKAVLGELKAELLAFEAKMSNEAAPEDRDYKFQEYF